MAKMLKQLVFGQKKNPPAPPRPDYEGNKIQFSEVCEEEEPFSEHDYENISRFRCQVRFGDKQKELLVFENYSEPADLRSEIATLEEDLYIAPLDDCERPTAPPMPEDMYCVPYDEDTAPRQEAGLPGVPPEDATYDVVPEDDEGLPPTEGAPVEYDEPWEWSVGARLTTSLQVSPTPSLEGQDEDRGSEDEEMRRQRRLLYETAFDSRVRRVEGEDEVEAERTQRAPLRAASRSSFGSTSGSSASSTPTHHFTPAERIRDHTHRSASPQARPPLNQNFERKISFSPQCSSNRSSSQESMGVESRLHNWKETNNVITSDKVDKSSPRSSRSKSTREDHKENSSNHSSSSSSHSPALRSSSLLSDVRPMDNLPQSPDNDLRSSEDYDTPWDGAKVHHRVNGSVSVPEKLSSTSSSARNNLTTSATHDKLLVEHDARPGGGGRKPSLNLSESRGRLTLDFGCSALGAVGEKVDSQLTLEKQGWYHGSISRVDAEGKLRVLKEGSYLVRNSESSKQDYSLSLRSSRGFMHMKIVPTSEGRFILGQFSNPFASIPEMIQHYSVNKLPIKGAEHMSLLYPVIDQLL